MSLATDHVDVVVVGAGPVGLVLARLLGQQGVRVAVVDPNRIVCQHPRATHLDDETMRTIQTLGGAELERRSLRQKGWWLTGPDEQPFLELAMPDVESDQGWFTDYQFHQPDFESLLRGALAADPGASLWFGWEATDLEQDATEVRVTLHERGTGRTPPRGDVPGGALRPDLRRPGRGPPDAGGETPRTGRTCPRRSSRAAAGEPPE